ncbi:MAG: hypothetical protein ACPL6C_04315, partial [bacterium]
MYIPLLLILFSSLLAQMRIEFEHSYGGSYTDEAHSIVSGSDGGYVIAGWTYSTDGDVSGGRGIFPDYWIVKLSTDGAILWQRVAGGSDVDYAYSVCKSDDGGYVVVGYSYSNDGDISGHHGGTSRPDMWVVKLDSLGEIIWERSIGGVGRDEGYDITQVDDGGYVVVGATYADGNDVPGNHGASDFFVAKLDRNGNIEWTRCYGGSSDEQAHSVCRADDGGCVVAGSTYSNDGDVSGNNGWQ